MLLIGIASLIVAMGVTWAVTPLVIRMAGRIGAVDHPGADTTHRAPMPRIGGIAVFAGFLAGLAFAAHASGIDILNLRHQTINWWGLAFAVTALFAVGLIDDLYPLSFRWKLLGQVVAAMLVWHWGFRVEVLTHPLGGNIELGLLSFPVTLLWVVGITNAVNLIDGLDGLAAGIALITTSVVAAIAFHKGTFGVTMASVALAGSLIGFLRYNFNPARIFLGDSGSMFLGFVLAVTSVRGAQKGTTAVAVLFPLLVLGLPLLDTGLAVVRRFSSLSSRGLRSTNALRYVVTNYDHLFLPDRGHIHHRLLALGLSHRGAVVLLYGVGGLFALSALVLVMVNNVYLALLLVAGLALTMATFVGLLYLRTRRSGHGDRAPGAPERERLAGGESFASSGGPPRR